MPSVRVLFVCLGNICRSPSAEAIMQKMLEDSPLKGKVECDSAGIIFHQGKGADERMKRYAFKRGYTLTSRSRRFDSNSDFENFDWIIVMDLENYQDILSQDPANKYADKVHFMTSWCSKHKLRDVPDPYYGGVNFDQVIDILEDACTGFLKTLIDSRTN